MSETVSNNPGASLETLLGLPPGLEAPATKPVVTDSAGTTTQAGAYTKSSLQEAEKGEGTPNDTARLNSSNPMPLAPNASLSSMDASQVSATQVNKFLGGIYLSALQEVMAELARMSTMRSMVDSKGFLDFTEVEKALAELIAEKQIEKGKIEMYTSFAKAMCCGVQAGVSAGMGFAIGLNGTKSTAGALATNFGASLNAVGGSDSVTSNLAEGIGGMMKANIDAQITILEFYKKLAGQMAAKMEEEGRKENEITNSVWQLWDKASSSIHSFTQRG